MDLSQKTISKIEQIIDTFKCPLDFRCYKSQFEELCDAVIIGDGKLVECTDEHAASCGFSYPFGDAYFCNCPLRAYVAKKFKK